MTALFLPIPPPDLARIVREEWEGERGVARLAGVDPGDLDVRMTGAILCPYALTPVGWAMMMSVVNRAILSLLDALEARGLAVEREPARVLGWAAVDELAGWGSGLPPYRLVRIVDLDPCDRRLLAHDAALFEARSARLEAARGPVAEDPKRAGALERHRAAYPGAWRK